MTSLFDWEQDGDELVLKRGEGEGKSSPSIAEVPDPPLARGPRGQSGRGHDKGFLSYEEPNVRLQHPHGHEIFEEMHRTDGDASQAISMCVNPVTGSTWAVEPFGGDEATDEDKQRAQDLEWALWEFMEPNLIGHLAEFLPVLYRSGFVAGEEVWARAEREGRTLLAPKYIGLRHPRSIVKWLQDGDQLTALVQDTSMFSTTRGDREDGDLAYGASGSRGEGEVTLPMSSLVYYRVGAEGDNWEGRSLLRPAYKHWRLKDLLERVDAVGAEREAVGLPVAYLPPGATPDQISALETALKNVRAGEQAYIMMPGLKAGEGAAEGTGWLLEILGFDGKGRDISKSLHWHSNKIAAAFLAEFMRLGHGETGARATADTQADPFLMSIEALAGIVERALKNLVKRFCLYNYGPESLQRLPRLYMSLVDSTALTELGDYVLKLVQVGALLPDAQLERFLRARADLPAPDPEAIDNREESEQRLRHLIVGADPTQPDAETQAKMDLEHAEAVAKLKPDPAAPGGPGKPKSGANKDPYGGNSRRDGTRNNGKGGAGVTNRRKRSGAPSGEGGRGQGRPRGAAHDAEDSDVILDDYAEAAPYDRWEYRWHELQVDFDAIEQVLDSAPQRLLYELGSSVVGFARELADSGTPLGEPLKDSTARADLRGRMLSTFEAMYDAGASYLYDEVAALQACIPGQEPVMRLDRGARDRGRAHLDTRAELAIDQLALNMRQAMLGMDLSSGDTAAAQAAAEQAGKRALARAAHDHATSAFIIGRHDAARQLADDGLPLVLARYNAKLDGGTCGPCWDADDDEPRPLDDPVRLQRQPPNPACHSTASGSNRCRCFETFELKWPEAQALSVSLDDATMPPWLIRVTSFLLARGMPADRVLPTAIAVAREVVKTGRVLFPGLRQVGAGDREGAGEAVRWVEAQAS